VIGAPGHSAPLLKVILDCAGDVEIGLPLMLLFTGVPIVQNSHLEIKDYLFDTPSSGIVF
jgi:hypothetical protein